MGQESHCRGGEDEEENETIVVLHGGLLWLFGKGKHETKKMNIEVYCDESRQEFFAKAGADQQGFTVIGSLWIKAENRARYNEAINALRKKHGFKHEFKWTKITPKKHEFFLDLIRLFFAESEEDMRFRCIVLPVKYLDAVAFCEGDEELMFYKFYYQVLHHWILERNIYRVYVDIKTNRVHNRLRILKECLEKANPQAELELVQALPSHEVNLLQLVDVLTGAVSAKFNGGNKSTAKLAVLKEIEDCVGHQIAATTRDEKKFNVFLFRPDGGW